MPETVMIWIHPEFINCHAGATHVFSGEERSTVGGTHRTTRNSIAEIRALCRKLVNIRCTCAGISCVATRLGNGVDLRKYRRDWVAFRLNGTSKYSNLRIRGLSPLSFSGLIYQNTGFLARSNLVFDFNRIPLRQ